MLCYFKLGRFWNQGVYELFEHTADLGLRVTAENRDQLFAEAGLGLYSMIVENLDELRATTSVAIRIDGDQADFLLFDWLNELLAVFDTRRLVCTRFDVRVSDTGLSATVFGEPLDPQRHRLHHEVKAITYHGLKVEKTPTGWRAEVIVDI